MNSAVLSPMKSHAAIAVVLFLGNFLFAQPATTRSQQDSPGTGKIANGEFVGLEEIKDYQPGQKWFHENSLLIRNNQAILDKVPIHIVKGKKQYSASDGGFITYRAHFSARDAQVFIALRPFSSDYIIFPTGGCEPYSKVTIFPVRVMKRGIEIDSVLYRATKFSKQKREQLSKMLQNEPMQYSGAPSNVQFKRPPCP